MKNITSFTEVDIKRIFLLIILVKHRLLYAHQLKNIE